MRFETQKPYQEPSPDNFRLCEMPLDVSNKLQLELAAMARAISLGLNPVDIEPSGSTMLWWITKGYARAYGDYIVNQAEIIDINSQTDKEGILIELGIIQSH